MTAHRVALLIDGDNIAPAHASRVIFWAKEQGRVDIARVYLNASHPSDWLTTPTVRAIHAGNGKNASDILMCIDAMELSLSKGISHFVLVSSDGDFSHIANRLRELGAHVLGIGEAKAPQMFRHACTEFKALTIAKPAPLVKKPTTIPSGANDIDRKIQCIIRANSLNGRGMRVARLGGLMYQKHNIRISDHPAGNWRGYLTQNPAIYDIDPRGPEAMVRLRPVAIGTA